MHERIESHKSRGEAEAERSLFSLAKWVPSGVINSVFRLASFYPQQGVAALATNIPGPRHRLAVGGREVAELWPCIPIALRVRTTIAILSYVDQLTFGVTGDYDTTPDIDQIASGIATEVLVLLAHARDRHVPDRPHPVPLGSITVRNRVIKAATFEGRTPEALVTDELIEFHREVAAGGVGMTTVAYCAVAPGGRTDRRQIWMRPEAVPGLRRLTDAVHAEGAAVSAQIGHAGPVANAASLCAGHCCANRTCCCATNPIRPPARRATTATGACRPSTTAPAACTGPTRLCHNDRRAPMTIGDHAEAGGPGSMRDRIEFGDMSGHPI